MDSLSLWNYKLDTSYKGLEDDSIKPLGSLTFWRIKPLDNNLIVDPDERNWRTTIEFEIFNLTDSLDCYDQSMKTRMISSCIFPDIGGDIILTSKFIFLNRSPCLRCRRRDTKADYCRTILKYIFSKLDQKKITTIESLVKQLIIKEGQL